MDEDDDGADDCMFDVQRHSRVTVLSVSHGSAYLFRTYSYT